MRLLPTLLLAGLAAACASGSETIEVDPARKLDLYMTTATYLYQDGDLVRAQDQAVKALQVDPKNRAMRQMIGWIRVQMGTTEDLLVARTMFQRLVEEEESVPAVLGLATVQERLGVGYDEAARAAASGERSARGGGGEERAAALRATAREHWRSAAANYEKVAAAPTASIKAMNGLQRTHALLGEYEEVLSWSARLLESAQAELRGLERILASRDLTESEEKVARKSRRASVDLQVETHLFAATLLARIGRPHEAIAHLDMAASLDPSRAEPFGRRAKARAEIEDWAGAIEDVDRFLRASDAPYEDPEVRGAYELRSRCERELRGIESARS